MRVVDNLNLCLSGGWKVPERQVVAAKHLKMRQNEMFQTHLQPANEKTRIQGNYGGKLNRGKDLIELANTLTEMGVPEAA